MDTKSEARRFVELFSAAVAWGAIPVVMLSFFYYLLDAWGSHPRFLDALIIGSWPFDSEIDGNPSLLIVKVAVVVLAVAGATAIRRLQDEARPWGKESRRVMLTVVGAAVVIAGWWLLIQVEPTEGLGLTPALLGFAAIPAVPLAIIAPLFGIWTTAGLLRRRARWLSFIWVGGWIAVLAAFLWRGEMLWGMALVTLMPEMPLLVLSAALGSIVVFSQAHVLERIPSAIPGSGSPGSAGEGESGVATVRDEARLLLEVSSSAAAWAAFAVVGLARYENWFAATDSHPRLLSLPAHALWPLTSGSRGDFLFAVSQLVIIASAVGGALVVRRLRGTAPLWSRSSRNVLVSAVWVAAAIALWWTYVQIENSGGFVVSPALLGFMFVAFIPAVYVAPLFGIWTTARVLWTRSHWLSLAWIAAWMALLALPPQPRLVLYALGLESLVIIMASMGTGLAVFTLRTAAETREMQSSPVGEVE